MVIDVTDDTFEKEVLGNSGVVIVDFYGTWCMPCKMMAPILEKIADENDVVLAKVDIDENDKLVREFGIMAVPTIKVFKSGVEIQTFVGMTSESDIKSAIK